MFEMESNPQQPQNSDRILWKKLFLVQNVPEKVKSLESKMLWALFIGEGGGILLFVISLLLILPVIGTGNNALLGTFGFGLSMGISISVTTIIALDRPYTMRGDFKLLSNWYSNDELTNYEESLTITNQVITLKVAKNVRDLNSISKDYLVGVKRDERCINIKDLSFIQFWGMLKTYSIIFGAQQAITSSTERPLDLVDYYYNGADTNVYFKIIPPYDFTREEVNQVLQVLTSLVPHVNIRAGVR